jgi:TP901 family phage tail tape measure protein
MEQRTVKIFIDDSNLEKTLERDRRKMEQLDRKINDLEKGTKQWNEVTAQRQQILQKIEVAEKQLAGTLGPSLSQLKEKQRQLNRELAHMPVELRKSSDAAKNLKVVQLEISKVNAEAKQTAFTLAAVKNKLGSAADSFNRYSSMALAALGTITGVGLAINAQIQYATKLDEAFADVMKTTGMTREEVEALSAEFQKMNTRTSRLELLELAYAAGKLGNQSTEDVMAFVRAADKIKIALGKDLGQDAITAIGKLVNIFGLKQEFGLEQSMLKIASTMNDLGMASEASEAYLSDFLKRMGGVAPLVKISAADTLALGATLDSLGQTAEVSSTALSKMFVDFAKEADTFSKFANMTAPEFRKSLETDFIGTFIKVLEGTKNNAQGINALADTLGDMGMEGGRAIGVLGALANNTDTLRKQIDIANNSFAKGTSVIDEYNIKNNTLGAVMDKVGRNLSGFFNSTFGPAIEAMVENLGRLTGVIKDQSEMMEEERMKANLLYYQIIDVNTSQADRIKLINELKAIHPGLLSGINAETVSNEELAVKMRDVNETLINNIILKKEDEKIQKHIEEMAKRRMSLIEKEDEVRKKIFDVAKKYNLEVKAGLTLEQQAHDILNRSVNKGKGGAIDYSRSQLSIIVSQLQTERRNISQAQQNLNRASSERQDLKTRLGITDFAPSAPTSVTLPVAPVVVVDEPNTKKAVATAKTEVKKLFSLAGAKGELMRNEIDWKDVVDFDEFEMMLEEVDAMLEENDNEDAFTKSYTAALQQEADDKLKNAKQDKQTEEDLLKQKIDNIHAVADITQKAFDGVFAYQQQKRNQDTAAEIDALNKQRDTELSNSKLTAAEREAIEQKFQEKAREIKMRAWKADKMAALTQAIMNGALAVVKSLPNIPLAIASGVAAASQIAIIASSKPPMFAKGGLLDGPSHQAGGMPVINPVTGQTQAYMEGGEAILSKETRRNNRNLVDSLLYNSMHRDGAPVSIPFISQTPSVNYGRIASAIEFGRGGIYSPNVNVNVPAPQANVSVDFKEISSMLQQNKMAIEALYHSMQQPQPVQIKIGNKEADLINEMMKENERLRNINRIG